MKMPALQFYPADWRKDPAVQALGYFDRGVWFEILCIMHESSERGVLLLNGLPMPDEALGNALGLDNQTLTITLTKILTYGAAKRRQADGAIYSKRMVEDERLCEIRRNSGKLGGNPALLNQKPTTEVKQTPTPSSSTSSSSSKTTNPPGNGSGAKSQAVDLVKDEIWKTGKAILENQGVNREAAGSFLGKLCKDYGQVLVLDAVRDCARETPAEAKAWLIARCQDRRAQSGNKSLAIEARNRAAAEAALRSAGAQ